MTLMDKTLMNKTLKRMHGNSSKELSKQARRTGIISVIKFYAGQSNE
jgi:hypothetical protein